MNSTKKIRAGSWFCDEEGNIIRENPLPAKKYTQKDKRLYQEAVSSESPAQLAERRKRNGKGLERYTRYL